MARIPMRRPRNLRLKPEWLGQSGLWSAEAGDGAFEPIDAEDAGLSEMLADRLEDWMDEFDSVLVEGDPAASRFAERSRFLAWRAEGEAIGVAIRRELGPGERLDVMLPDELAPT